jgi:hypothetical protein
VDEAPLPVGHQFLRVFVLWHFRLRDLRSLVST